MKCKRILAVVMAAALTVSGSLAAGATEVEDAEPSENAEITEEFEIEEYSAPAEDTDPAEDPGDADDAGAVAELSLIAGEDDAVVEEEAEAAVEAVAEETAGDLDDSSEMEVGRYTGMKEIGEIDPDLLGSFEESDSGIQTFATTEYTPYSRSYEYTTLSFSSSGGHSADEILDMAVTLINGNEGGYNTVTPNDNNSGAMSIGKIQWWADSALLLAQLIVSADNKTAYELLGADLYNDIITSKSWSSRVLVGNEITYMKNFLDPDKNPASKTVQDKLANSYVATYINNGYKLGIRNAAALVYYADIENQYGYSGGSMGGSSACAKYAYNIAGVDGSWSKVTLNELHLAGIANVAHNYASRSNVGAYLDRRRYTYGKLVSSGWTYCNSGDYTIPYDSNGTVGAAWLKSALNIYQKAGLTINNDYDDALKSAVKKYQTSAGLTVDGLAGLHTSTKLIHDMFYTSMQTLGASPQIGGSGPDIVKKDGVWTYTYNDEPDYSYTGLAKNSNGWYYIKDGVLDRSYTGFATNENGSWYMTNGKLTRKDNTVLKDEKGALGAKNEWYYVIGSKVQYDFTGLANYKNASGWWYITKGRVDRSVNTVAKNKNGWYYVVDGKVRQTFTGLANYKNASGWWYITKGKVDRTVNTVAKNKNGWYYVVNGKVQKSFTGLANYKNASGWWYIKNGAVDRSYNGIATNKNGTYYIKNGKVQQGFTGTVTIDGKKYSVNHGKVS